MHSIARFSSSNFPSNMLIPSARTPALQMYPPMFQRDMNVNLNQPCQTNTCYQPSFSGITGPSFSNTPGAPPFFGFWVNDAVTICRHFSSLMKKFPPNFARLLIKTLVYLFIRNTIFILRWNQLFICFKYVRNCTKMLRWIYLARICFLVLLLQQRAAWLRKAET